jgi:hypothetical protein
MKPEGEGGGAPPMGPQEMGLNIEVPSMPTAPIAEAASVPELNLAKTIDADLTATSTDKAFGDVLNAPDAGAADAALPIEEQPDTSGYAVLNKDNLALADSALPVEAPAATVAATAEAATAAPTDGAGSLGALEDADTADPLATNTTVTPPPTDTGKSNATEDFSKRTGLLDRLARNSQAGEAPLSGTDREQLAAIQAKEASGQPFTPDDVATLDRLAGAAEPAQAEGDKSVEATAAPVTPPPPEGPSSGTVASGAEEPINPPPFGEGDGAKIATEVDQDIRESTRANATATEESRRVIPDQIILGSDRNRAAPEAPREPEIIDAKSRVIDPLEAAETGQTNAEQPAASGAGNEAIDSPTSEESSREGILVVDTNNGAKFNIEQILTMANTQESDFARNVLATGPVSEALEQYKANPTQETAQNLYNIYSSESLKRQIPWEKEDEEAKKRRIAAEAAAPTAGEPTAPEAPLAVEPTTTEAPAAAATSETPASSSAETATPPIENRVDTEARATELQEKVKNGTATPAEKAELQTINVAKSREEAYQRYNDRLAEGTVLSKEEFAELQKMDAEKATSRNRSENGPQQSSTLYTEQQWYKDQLKAKDAKKMTGAEKGILKDLNTIESLEAKKARGEQIDEAELTRLQTKVQSEADEARYDHLATREANGEALTEDERAELDQRNEKKDQDISAKINKLGTEIHNKLELGKPVSDEEFLQLQKLQMENAARKNGLSPEATKAMVAAMSDPEAMSKRMRNLKEKGMQQEIQKRLAQLMNLERQALGAQEQMKKLEARENDLKDKIKEKNSEIGFYTNPTSPDKLTKRQELYGLMMQQANIKSQKDNLKYMGAILRADYKDTMQYVRRKLGLSNPIVATLEFLDAKFEGIVIDAGVNASQHLDSKPLIIF